VRLRRERRSNGSDRIYYAPGFVTLLELAAFVQRFPRERFPRERAKPLQRAAPPAEPSLPSLAHPPEAAAAAPPEEASMEHRDQDPIEPSSCEATGEIRAATTKEQKLAVTKEDEEIAQKALAARMQRKHPTRRPPRWFDAGELVIVAACSAAIEGDAETKLLAHSDAIAGAFIASRDGPPTVRFIWEKLDHFFDHVDRGRRRRLADERKVRMRLDAECAESAPEPTRVHAATRVPYEQMSVDLEKLFGRDWKKQGPGR
jgi:hypothetical protein